MSYANWDRQYRLKIDNVTSSIGYEVGKPDPITGRALHINFSIEKTDGTTLNTTKIQLWNLNKDQINILTKEGCSVELCAGYGESLPCVFTGTVSMISEDLDGADRLVEIDAVDGFAQLNDTPIVVSFAGKVLVSTILEHVAMKLGLPIVYSAKAKAKTQQSYYPNGYTFVGKAQKPLSECCTKAGVKWSIQNGICHITYGNETITKIVHVLSKETGLLGIPKRLYNSAVNASTDEDAQSSGVEGTLYGYEVEFFMIGSLSINDLVLLKSNIVSGNFRISTMKIEGDNLSGDWKCIAELVEAL